VDPWIFIHGTDKVESGLMVLFFGLFSVALLEIFLSTPLVDCALSGDKLNKIVIFIMYNHLSRDGTNWDYHDLQTKRQKK